MKREIKFRAWNSNGMTYFTINHRGLHGLTEIMQYIGRKDKNSKELYEGDIVTENLYWDTTKNDVVYFEVVFVDNGFKIKDKKGNIYEIGLEPVVVGNIYENPELLKQS